ncbi:hypothetical protein BGP_0897 [Beggiatoa sp. PS]|nr:hypothetical protein BGP_0897 [Beggiatoa sp. PS]
MGLKCTKPKLKLWTPKTPGMESKALALDHLKSKIYLSLLSHL